MRKTKMWLSPKAILRLALLPLAVLFVFCKDDRSTDPEEEKALLTVLPSVLEAGTRALVSMAGEHTEFGDSVWLEKNGHRIHGTRQGSGTDISLVAEFEIPENASPGSWDVVVQDKARDSATRLAKGITLVPARAWIRGISPAKFTTHGTHRITITIAGVSLGSREPQVRLFRDTRSLDLKSTAVVDDTSFATSVTVAGAVFAGEWDLEVVLPSRRMILRKALEIEPIPASLVSVSEDTLEQDWDVTMLITGMNTLFGNGASTVWLENGTDSIPAMSENEYFSKDGRLVKSDALLKAHFHIPADAAVGAWNLRVRQPWYTLTKTAAIHIFNSTPPAVKAIRPGSARRSQELELVCVGHRTLFNTEPILSLVRGTDTLLTTSDIYDIPKRGEISFRTSIPVDAPLGSWDVHVKSFIPNGSSNDPEGGEWESLEPLINGFTVLDFLPEEARIDRVTPDTIETGTWATLEIHGTNTLFGDSVLLEREFFNQIPGVITGSATDTSLTAVFEVPPETLLVGNWNLHINQRNGRPNLKLARPIPMIRSIAAVTSVKPDTISRAVVTTITLKARNMNFLEEPVTVEHNERPVDQVGVMDDETLQFDIYIDTPFGEHQAVFRVRTPKREAYIIIDFVVL